MTGAPPLMLFTLEHGRHYSTFVRFLLEGWRRSDGELVAVLSPRGAANQPARPGARILAVDPAERAWVKQAREDHVPEALGDVLAGRLSPDSPAARHWAVLRRYAERVQPGHVLIVSLESVWGAVAAGLEAPCRFSGILAAPPERPDTGGDSPRARARRLHERVVVERVLDHPGLDTLFHLHARSFAGALRGGEKLQRLEVPARLAQVSAAAREDLRARLAIEPNRRVCLLFGHLSRRKGLLELAEAARQLPESVARRVCLAFVGHLDDGFRPAVAAALSRLRAETPLQLVEHFEWLPEEDVPTLFALADVVAAPYVEDFGASGVLALAAAAERPVLATDVGAVGASVREHKLGLAVDPTVPAELVAALARLLATPDAFVDRDAMRRLAGRGSPEAFARTVFDRIRAPVAA